MAHLTPIQIVCQTQLTKKGERNMKNRKPFRTAAQKREAQRNAWKIDGRWVSSANVSFH